MAEKKWGQVVARGTAADIALVRKALDECVNVTSPPAEDRLKKDFVIEVHSPAEFVAAGAIIPGSKDAKHPKGVAAEGYSAPGQLPSGDLWINRKIVSRKPKRARHIVRHEISHNFPLTDEKRAEFMAKMRSKDGKRPTKWRGGLYEARPNECYADTMAEAMSNVDSPWDDYDYYLLDVDDLEVPAFVEITFRQTAQPPTVEPPATPLPPVDPEKQQLRDENAALLLRITAKNNKATELIAL